MSVDSKLLLALRAKRMASSAHSLWGSYSELCNAKDTLIDLKEQAIEVKEALTDTVETINENRKPSDIETLLEILTKE